MGWGRETGVRRPFSRRCGRAEARPSPWRGQWEGRASARPRGEDVSLSSPGESESGPRATLTRVQFACRRCPRRRVGCGRAEARPSPWGGKGRVALPRDLRRCPCRVQGTRSGFPRDSVSCPYACQRRGAVVWVADAQKRVPPRGGGKGRVALPRDHAVGRSPTRNKSLATPMGGKRRCGGRGGRRGRGIRGRVCRGCRRGCARSR